MTDITSLRPSEIRAFLASLRKDGCNAAADAYRAEWVRANGELTVHTFDSCSLWARCQCPNGHQGPCELTR